MIVSLSKLQGGKNMKFKRTLSLLAAAAMLPAALPISAFADDEIYTITFDDMRGGVFNFEPYTAEANWNGLYIFSDEDTDAFYSSYYYEDLDKKIRIHDTKLYLEGWYYDKEYTQPFTPTDISSDTQLYAKWAEKITYTITFDDMRGGVYDFEPFTVGGDSIYDAINNEGDPYYFSKEDADTLFRNYYYQDYDNDIRLNDSGLYLESWYYDKELTKLFLPISVSSDIQLYAKWIEAIRQVHLDFDFNAAGKTPKEFEQENLGITGSDNISVGIDGQIYDVEDHAYLYDMVKTIVDPETGEWTSEFFDEDVTLEEGKKYEVVLKFSVKDHSKGEFVYDKDFKKLINDFDHNYAEETGYDNGRLYFTFTCQKGGGKLGDINSDNDVNTQDALLSISFAKKRTAPKDSTQMKAADVNGDGIADSKDAMKIINAAKTRTSIGEFSAKITDGVIEVGEEPVGDLHK